MKKVLKTNNLRNSIITVVNEILRIREQGAWGEGTSCASDSKKFGAWDQNLMTEWHIRYRGRGVMIHWHVEKNSTCIYPQLKSCSSSEVASIIEGVLRHCTQMNVDTHGQSEVAFAFSHLLNFSLMPRFKNINRQKIYLPENSLRKELKNLSPVLTRQIDWNIIKEQYDQMIKYTTALRLGTAETEARMKRFTRNNLEDQELSVLSLHLLQNCLVYINTLMIQDILSKQDWQNKMQVEDYRALTPLKYQHVNPYGNFNLNMNERIPIEV